MRDSLKDFYKEVLSKRFYSLSLMIITSISYLFSMTNRTVSIDGISGRYYNNPQMVSSWIAGKRWGFVLVNWLFSTDVEIPFVNHFIGTLFFVLASIMLSFLLFSITNQKEVIIYTIVSGSFLSFPLINEIYEYEDCDVYVSLNFCLIILTVLVHLYYRGKILNKLFIETIVLVPVAAGYESVAFAYVTLVLAVICIRLISDSEIKPSSQFVDGLIQAIPLVLSIIVKFLVGIILIYILNTPNSTAGASQIMWCVCNPWDIVRTNIYLYFARGILYLPIFAFALFGVLACGSIVFCTKKQKKWGLTFWVMALISVFGQSIIQCSAMPYRTAQTVHIFTSVNIFIFLMLVSENVPHRVSYIIFALCMFLVFRQSISLCRLLTLNNQRSTNEAILASQIGYRVLTEFDNDKPVVFVGQYWEGSWIDRAMTVREPSKLLKLDNRFRMFLGLPEVDCERVVDTNVRSYLSWGARAEVAPDLEVLKWYFSYWGYDINVVSGITPDEKNNYETKAKELGMTKYQILDADDCILVCLGW